MTEQNNNNTLCKYDGRTITVAEYHKQPNVQAFESRLKKLAYKSALCNFDGTSVYGETYPPLRDGFPTHQNRRCIYFETHVLPSDPKLETDYWNVMQGGKVSNSVMTGICRSCEQTFNKEAKNQVYCDLCRDSQRKQSKRKYNIKYNAR